MVTINVPNNRLRGIFLAGFSISPAINVTLFHASLLNKEPTMARPSAVTTPHPEIASQPEPSTPFFASIYVEAHQASVQLFLKKSNCEAKYNPQIIKPNNANNFANVNMR